MEVIPAVALVGISAVQADDVVALVFYPNAPDEAAVTCLRLGLNVENQAAQIAKKFPPHIAEVVVLAVEFIAVGVNHPGKSRRIQPQGITFRQRSQEAFQARGSAQ